MRRSKGDKKLMRTAGWRVGVGECLERKSKGKELTKKRGGLEREGKTYPESESERAARRLGQRGSTRKRAVKSEWFKKSGQKRTRESG